MALPAEVTTGTITATILKAIVDGVDADLLPDGVPLSGQVTFSPEIGRRGDSGQLLGGGRLLVASATPPVTIVAVPIPVALDVDGALSVDLIATDNPDIAPTGWTWTVSFGLDGVTIPPFSFEVLAGTTADLSTLAPLEISTGSALFINEAAASAASAAASAASAALSASLVGAPADTAVATIVGNPASDTATVLSSTYGTLPKNTIIPLGTSITELNYGPGTSKPNGYQARGYLNWALCFLGQRLQFLRNAGVPGDTTAMMLARIQTDVIAYAPGWCLIEVGPNDATLGVATATTQANIVSMVGLLTAAGIKAAVTTPTTCTVQTTGQRQAALTTGAWLRRWAQTQPNVVLVDFASVWVEPIAGGPVMTPSPVSDEGTHPSANGGQMLGQLVANALSPLVPAARQLPTANIDPSNLLTNGMAVGNSGGLATGFGVNGALTAGARAVTNTKVARTDGIPGEWQQMAVGPSNLADCVMNWPTISTGFAVGDVVEAFIEFQRVPGAVTTFGTTQQFLQAALIPIGGTGTVLWCDRISTELCWTTWPLGGVARTPPLTIPTGTTALVLQFMALGVDGGLTLQFGRALVRKV